MQGSRLTSLPSCRLSVVSCQQEVNAPLSCVVGEGERQLCASKVPGAAPANPPKCCADHSQRQGVHHAQGQGLEPYRLS